MSPPCIYILNGPNLNLLGQREPHIYGRVTLKEIEERCRRRAASLDLGVDFRQTNFEGALVESIHEAREKAAGVIVNPAGYTFTSVALLDALKTFEGPKIELHISNVHAREATYHNSLISRVVTGIMIGFGAAGYEHALTAIHQILSPHDQSGAG